MADYQVAVIGAGPAGYVAAIRCAQLGMQVVCIDKQVDDKGKPALGGTCLNVGCIPSKALLDSSHHYSFLQQQAKDHGIYADNVRIDVSTMQGRKTKIVQQLTRGIASLFKKNNITHLAGQAVLHPDKHINVTLNDGNVQTITAETIIIATGSSPVELPFAKFHSDKIVDSSGGLAFEEVPERLGILGAGAIGLELGSIWSRLGSQVDILELSPEFLPTVDRKIADLAFKTLQKQGINIGLNRKVTSVIVKGEEITVAFESESQGRIEFYQPDKLIVAVGRRPNTHHLGLEALGIQLDNRGFIQVDENKQTHVAGIYAIGDVIGGPMLAHKGSEEGIMVAERLAGLHSTVDYITVPWVIYTTPEIAWVGSTEAQLQASNVNYKAGEFPLIASGRAKALGETTGLVRMFADAKTERILGIHIFAPQASELISEAVLAMAFEASSEDLACTMHAHPTLSESLHEAAFAVDDRGIHI